MSESHENLVQEIESLVRIRVPYTRDSPEFKSMTLRPHLIQSYQDILEDVDVKLLNSLPWFPWMTALSSRLIEGTEGLKEIASVKELIALKAGVNKLFMSTLMPYLPCDLPYPTSAKKQADIFDEKKLACMDLATRVLLLVGKNDHLRSWVMRYFGELVCALIYLNCSRVGKTNTEQSRAFYQHTVTSLLDDTHQPTVFTHLMILLTARGDGGRISRIARKILDNKLQRKGGVEALIAATLLLHDGPSSTQDVMKVSNLLVSKRPDLFYRAVLPQVMQLLHGEEVKEHQVAAHCIAYLQDQNPAHCETYFFGPILSSLEKPCDEGDIESTLRCLQAWVDAAPPQINLARPLPALCFLYTALYEKDRTSKVKVPLCKLLATCFSRLSMPCSYMQNLLFPPHPGVYFTETVNHSVVSLYTKDPVENLMAPQIILEFVSIKDFPKVKCEIYKFLLEYVVDSRNPVDRRMVSTEILSELSEEQPLIDALCEQPQYILDFLSNIFTKGNVYDDSIITFGLILLTVFLNDNLVHKKSNWVAISKLEKPLEDLSRSMVYTIRSLAKEILIRLSDYGIIEDKRPEKPLPFVMKEPPPKEENKPEIIECSYDEAYQEAVDPQLPVRAHAMRALAKLIQKKDRKTMSNQSTLLTLFKVNLEHDDSYLYLSAIEGLSSLAAAFPDDVLLSLCEEFVLKKLNTEQRLKIGEALMKTINILGVVGATYKDVLIGTFLTGVKDLDPLVRASSLSNIGEVAKIFSFRINTFIVEILNSVERVVDTDPDVEPRRAAIMLIALLIQGFGESAVTVLGDVLPTMYRKLKLVYNRNEDDVTKLHAQIALDHINHLMRTILFAKPNFTKSISLQDLSK